MPPRRRSAYVMSYVRPMHYHWFFPLWKCYVSIGQETYGKTYGITYGKTYGDFQKKSGKKHRFSIGFSVV